jgi:hypothetical protein
VVFNKSSTTLIRECATQFTHSQILVTQPKCNEARRACDADILFTASHDAIGEALNNSLAGQCQRGFPVLPSNAVNMPLSSPMKTSCRSPKLYPRPKSLSSLSLQFGSDKLDELRAENLSTQGGACTKSLTSQLHPGYSMTLRHCARKFGLRIELIVPGS